MKHPKVTPQNVKEYKVIVTIRAYAEDGAAYQRPDEGHEEHALAAIVSMEEVAVVGLEKGTTIVLQRLLMAMEQTGWPVKPKK